MIHTPVQSFHGNWLWWQAAALAHYVVRWLRVFALPQPWHRVRGKRLRLALLNVAARVTRSARRLHLRLPRHYPHATMFIAALRRIRALPAIRLTGPVRPQSLTNGLSAAPTCPEIAMSDDLLKQLATAHDPHR